MGYFGRYFGGGVSAAVPTPPPAPALVAAPILPSEPEYVDHVQLAIDRLCEQFKTKKSAT